MGSPWCGVYPYQVRFSTLGAAAKQLAQLASTGANWPYALVQLNGNAHHVPLPKEGHLSVLAEEHTSLVPTEGSSSWRSTNS